MGLTLPTLVGVVLVAVFVVVAALRPRRAVVMYALLGATPPAVQLGAFAGRTITQGLLLAEALASILIVAWVVNRRPAGRLRTSFDTPLFMFAAVAAASLVASVALPDESIAGSVNFAVSVGQLLLVLWPVGVYLASAELIPSTAQLLLVQRAMIGLAVFQFAMPVVPELYRDYMVWAWTFGLFASPFAIAAAFGTTSIVNRVLLVGIALTPAARGIQEGKVFLYGFVLAGAATVLWLRASRMAAVAVGTLTAVALVAVFVAGEDALVGPLRGLIETERSQSSFGGDSGRGALAAAALSIWAEAPLLGVGPGNSYLYMLQRSPIGTPHNQYLNILTEFGIVGLVVWLWFLAATWSAGLRVFRRTIDPVHKTYVLGWLGVFAGMMVGGLTGDYQIHSIRNGGLELFSGYYLQWVLLGGLVTVARLEQLRSAAPAAAAASPLGSRRRWPRRVRVGDRRRAGRLQPRTAP